MCCRYENGKGSMAKLEISTDDLEWTRDYLDETCEGHIAPRVIAWLDYMIAGLKQAEEIEKKEWTTKE